MTPPLINHGGTREHKFISAPAALCNGCKTHDGSDVKREPRVFEAERVNRPVKSLRRCRFSNL